MDSAIARSQHGFERLVIFRRYLLQGSSEESELCAYACVCVGERELSELILHTMLLKLISPLNVSRRILARVELPDRNATSTVIEPLNDVKERLCLSPVDGGGGEVRRELSNRCPPPRCL
jgi:hypothetical protein